MLFFEVGYFSHSYTIFCAIEFRNEQAYLAMPEITY
jgi:hypothetical protein